MFKAIYLHDAILNIFLLHVWCIFFFIYEFFLGETSPSDTSESGSKGDNIQIYSVVPPKSANQITGTFQN